MPQISELKLMAIDPGPHTGMAVWLPSYGYKAQMTQDMDEVRTWIDDLIPDVLIIERFATAGRISVDGLFTVDLVGQVKGMVWLLNKRGCHIDLKVRTPSQRRAFMFEAREMKITEGPHELDALAHLLAWKWLKEHGRNA